MTRQEIIDKLVNGKFTAENGLEFRKDDDDDTIHVDWKDDESGKTFQAFHMKHSNSDMRKWHITGANELEDANRLIVFLQKIIDFTGADVRIKGSVEKEVIKEIDPHHDEFLKAQGQIEVYEKIIIGRPLQIG